MTVKQFLQTSILFTIVLAALGAAAKPVMDAFAAVDAYPIGDRQQAIAGAEIEVLVDDTQWAISQVTQLTVAFDGYLINSQTWYVDGFKHATLELEIPADSFERMINELYDLGVRVIRENSLVLDTGNAVENAQSAGNKIITRPLRC